MTTLIRLPAPLRPAVGGAATVPIDASDLATLPRTIGERYPELAKRILDGDGFARFVTVFVDGEDTRFLPVETELGSARVIEVLPAVSGGARTADPYRDTDVIDSRAPRANQAVVGIVSVVAVATGWWPLLWLLAAQLAIGLTFGRRYCLACVLYFEVIQPRFGEGPIEDARPPRFANIVGATVLSAATLAYVLGATGAGIALGALVAALALLAATTGLCVGCEMYKLAARFRGIRPRQFGGIDPSLVPAFAQGERVVVEFTHPLCTACHELERELRASGARVVIIDVSRRPDLARRYGIAYVPTAVEVDARGVVLARIAG